MLRAISISLCLSLLLISGCSDVSPVKKKPNILVIVGDDIGYSDFGFMGAEVTTPNLNQLAEESTLFKNFHVSPTCSVTRSMLLTGVDSHLVGLGAFDYTIYPPLEKHVGYETYLTKNAVTVATILKENGYNTYASGKWHLGEKEGHLPSDRGFEKSFMLLEGAGGHFNNVGITPSHAVTHFTENGAIVPRGSTQYSDTLFTEKMLKMLDGSKGSDKPFFAYFAFQSAHWPLQVPDETWKKYIDKYKGGFAPIQQARYDSMIKKGIIPKDSKMRSTDDLEAQWKKLPQKKKDELAKRYALYMSMIEIQDRHIGQLFKYLKDNKMYDDTIIFYLTDNGPEGTDVELPFATPSVAAYAKKNFDNSLDNLGSKTSLITIGRTWARVSATPLHFFKGYTSEGGIRVPLLIKDLEGKRKGQKTDVLADVKDISATILDFAGIEFTQKFYQGRSILPMSGVSIAPFLLGKKETIYQADDYVGRSLFYNPAVFMGDYKLIKLRTGMHGGDGKFHLYNVVKDPAEMNDLMGKNKELADKMKSVYLNYQLTNNVQPIEEDWDPAKAVK